MSRGALSTLLIATLLTSGCSIARRSAPPAADIAGSYVGVLRLDGDEIESRLTLEQDGGRIQAALSSDVGLSAAGRGRLEGTVLRIELEYSGDCAGSVLLAGQALDGGSRLAGTVEAEDCTGGAAGSFSFRR